MKNFKHPCFTKSYLYKRFFR